MHKILWVGRPMPAIFLTLFLFLPSYCEAFEPIRIGSTVSMEGKYKETSFMIRNSYKLWEQQVNSRGGLLGRPVELIFYDDRSDGKLVKQNYEKLLNQDRVDLVLSPYGTPLTLIASEVTERHGKIMLASAASGEKIWDRGYKYVFGVYALAKRYFIGFVDLLARYGFDSLVILYEDSPFCRDVAAGTKAWAKRFGIEVLFEQSFKDGPVELSGLLKKIKQIGPDALVLSAYPPDAYELIRQIKIQQYRPKALGITIAPVHPDFYKRVGKDAEGIFGPSQWEPDERIPFPGTKKFIADFRRLTKKSPSYHGGAAYAACQILERAITKKESLNQEKIRDFIRSLDTVTVIGRFKVDEKGRQIGHNPIMIQWQKGKKEIVYPLKMKTAAPIL